MRKVYLILILVIPLSMAFSLFHSPEKLGDLNLEKIDKYDLVENFQLSDFEIVSNCDPPSSSETYDFWTISDGNWNDPSTWNGGDIPPPNENESDIDGKKIKITHNVTLGESYNIKLKGGSILSVIGQGSSLTVENGSILLEGPDVLYVGNGASLLKIEQHGLDVKGSARAIFEGIDLLVAGNVQLDNSNTSICMTDVDFYIGEEECGPDIDPGNDYTGANFHNKGYRYLLNVCGNVTENFINEGTDIIVNSCIDVGDYGDEDKAKDGQDSGNLQNDNGTMSIEDSEFYVAENIQNSASMNITNSDFRTTNGSFQQNSGSITGSDIVIWIDDTSHNIERNSGTWNASTISHWRTNGSSTPKNLSGIVDESSLDEIAVHFNCGCDPDPLSSLGDYVWFDNGFIDGVQETGEPGIENVRVQLFKVGNSTSRVVEEVFKETWTDENGYYIFKDLEADEYYLKFQCPGDLHMCPCDAGTNDAKDSDIEHHIDDPEDIGRTADITLNWNEHNMTIDGGFTEAPLPLEFGSLSAKVRDTDVILEWTTFTEVNNEGFYIERTNRGVEGFREIAFIEGVGNSTEVQIYEYTDENLKVGIQYEYRIKYIGMDGEITYSDAVSVTVGSVSEMYIYPNPTTGTIHVSLPGSMINPVIQVYDPIGRLIYDFRPQESITTHAFDLSVLNNGVYLIVARDTNFTFSERIIISH